MKRAAWYISLIFAASSLMAGHALARSDAAMDSDTQKQSQQAQSGSQSQQQQQALRELDDVNGMTVQNAQGENLGKISEVLVDVQAGKIGYAVVSSGGVLGMGEDKYIVPFRALKGSEGDSLLLDMPADRFKQAPKGSVEQAFSKEQGRQIHQFYGISPYWEESGSQSQPSQPDSQMDRTQQSGEQEEQD